MFSCTTWSLSWEIWGVQALTFTQIRLEVEGLTTQGPNLRVALTTACRVGDDINLKCQWKNIWCHCVLPLWCLTAHISLNISPLELKFFSQSLFLHCNFFFSEPLHSQCSSNNSKTSDLKSTFGNKSVSCQNLNLSHSHKHENRSVLLLITLMGTITPTFWKFRDVWCVQI